MTESSVARPGPNEPRWPQAWPPPGYPPHLHLNAFDRRILHGRDPWRPVALVRFERLRWTLVLTVMAVIAFSGVIALAGQSKAYQSCVQRNESALRYREDLDRRATLAHQRKQYEDEAIYRSLRPRDKLPSC